MSRRKRYYKDENPFIKIAAIIVTLAIVGLVVQLFTDPGGFARSMIPIFGIVLIIIIWKITQKVLNGKHINALFQSIKERNQEEYLKNFINRFGFESGKSKGWSYRNHNFDWDRINDLKKILKEANITSNEKDVFILLRFYIQEKEESLTRESIHTEPQRLAHLTGAEFEKLLYRLFEAMGYKTELTGRSGDQGGDLIANKNGERVLVQAKCYRDWSTGNAAVQQVVGAMKHYDCSRTMVVTTSHFTNEAITLAKDNKTELVSKERLQELLLNFLGESWV